MKMMLAENIRTFRKERSLTQEQLAEALGVTAGAVYKWEAKLSIPELGLIIQMADFFDISVDVLLGYEVRDNRLETTVKRLQEYRRSKDWDGLAEAEKALKKYPPLGLSMKVLHCTVRLDLTVGIRIFFAEGWNCWNRPFCCCRKTKIPRSASRRSMEKSHKRIWDSVKQTRPLRFGKPITLVGYTATISGIFWPKVTTMMRPFRFCRRLC